MKRFLFGLILGIGFTCAAIWYLGEHKTSSPAGQVGDRIETVATDVKNQAEHKLESWGLTPDAIKDELAKDGRVVRRKVQSAETAIVDAAADARITTSVKAKLVGDPSLSALSITVSTTDGLVTLSGTASSTENIQKAVTLAMNTDGVREVVSTLQVK